jgi:hypothetical protein
MRTILGHAWRDLKGIEMARVNMVVYMILALKLVIKRYE